MGALKVRVGGAWVTLPGYGNTVGVPAGGVLGDLLIKNSATAGDARWGINPPKLTLGGESAQYPTALTVSDSVHATSRRAGIGLGSGWQFLQDLNGNGTKDFGIFQNANNRTVFSISADGLSIALGTAAGSLITLGSDANVRIGDDAALRDVNVPNMLSIQGVANSTLGMLRFGSGSGKYIGNDSNMTMKSDGPIYYDATQHHFRSAGGSPLFFHNGSLFQIQADTIYALNTAANAWRFQFTSSRFYTAQRIEFAQTGFVFVHESDTDTGLYYAGDGDFGIVSQGNLVAEGYAGTVLCVPNYARIRLYTKTDSNHELQYVSSTPTGSGEASNGPKLNGYGSVWLHQQVGDKSIYLASSGNAYVNAGNSWITFSSRDFKRNIKTLDPERALLMVGRWRPVEYDWNEGVNAPHPHGFGFIAEEHAEVLPEMCSIYGESVDGLENERVVIHRPGWAHGISYGDGVPWLAGAIQALLTRVEALETELERKAA